MYLSYIAKKATLHQIKTATFHKHHSNYMKIRSHPHKLTYKKVNSLSGIDFVALTQDQQRTIEQAFKYAADKRLIKSMPLFDKPLKKKDHDRSTTQAITTLNAC